MSRSPGWRPGWPRSRQNGGDARDASRSGGLTTVSDAKRPIPWIAQRTAQAGGCSAGVTSVLAKSPPTNSSGSARSDARPYANKSP